MPLESTPTITPMSGYNIMNRIFKQINSKVTERIRLFYVSHKYSDHYITEIIEKDLTTEMY